MNLDWFLDKVVLSRRRQAAAAAAAAQAAAQSGTPQYVKMPSMNYKRATTDIANAYKVAILEPFDLEKTSWVFSDDQKKEEIAAKIEGAMGPSLLRVCRDQFNIMQHLFDKGDLANTTVKTEIFDRKSESVVMTTESLERVAAAQRSVLNYIIENDRNANNIPLSTYDSASSFSRVKFAKGDKFDRTTRRETFDLAKDLREGGEWAKATPFGKQMATVYYNYTASKMANIINGQKGNAFTMLFRGQKTTDELYFNAQLYKDLSEWGLIDPETKKAVALAAHHHAQHTGDYRFYYLTMFCFANTKSLQGLNPELSYVAEDFGPKTAKIIADLKQGNNAPMTGPAPQVQNMVPAQTGNGAFIFNANGNGINAQPVFVPQGASYGAPNQHVDRSYALLTSNAKGEDETIYRLVDERQKTVAKAIGLKTADLATNIAALSGLANGITNELFSRQGRDKIRYALQDPKSQIFVIQGIAQSAMNAMKQMGSWVER